tara:strand:+ start:798 stop:1181 length:384 start_codon:yes stop_codon:yes gene_type:complete
MVNTHFRHIIAIFSILLILTSIGTYTYSELEGWSALDSTYFTIITITTIGYGDLTPTTQGAKLFTIFFSLAGVALMLYTLTIIGKVFFDKEFVRKKQLIEKKTEAIETKKEVLEEIGKLKKKNKIKS